MKTNTELEVIPFHTMKRMRAYLNFLRFALLQKRNFVSAQRIADEFNLSAQTVLDDLSYTAAIDPELGITNTKFMIDSIEKVLGFNQQNEYIYIGDDLWFENNRNIIQANVDISISAYFDEQILDNPKLGFVNIVNPISKLADLLDRMHINKAIIAPGVTENLIRRLVPLMEEHGVKLVWNLAVPIKYINKHIEVVNAQVLRPNDLIMAIELIKTQLKILKV